MYLNDVVLCTSKISIACRVVAGLLLAATLQVSYSQPTARYDGKSALRCGTNVNCASQTDVIAKMKTRWVVHSSKTHYSDPCFQSISRVQGINAMVWSEGMAQQQMEVCNMH